MNDLPKGTFARTSVAGLATAKVGAKHLKSLAKRPFLSAKDQHEEKGRLEDETARILFQTFSQLRGTALKLAQMVSMETELLPESYRRELSKSYHQVPPLNRTLVRKALIQELGAPPEKLFASFDAQAFAAASLGQVHAAQSHEGESLAVKVQYPGIAVTIDNDVRLLRGLLRTAPQSDILLQGLREVHERLREEVDYEHEAASCEWFRNHTKLPGIVIPRVFPATSTARILTTERLQGLHLTQWLETGPSQEERDHAAQGLYDHFVHSVYELHRLHADPNPGNFLFKPNGSIGVIDFGCTRTLSSQFSTLLLSLLTGYLKEDRDQVLQGYCALGMLHEHQKNENEEFYEAILKPFGKWISRPLLENTYDFGNHEGYATEGVALARKMMRHFRFRSMSEEFVFVDRTYHGLFQIFEKMSARVHLRHPLLEEALES